MREDRLTACYGQPEESDNSTPKAIIPRMIENKQFRAMKGHSGDWDVCMVITPQNVDFDTGEVTTKKSRAPQIPERVTNQLPVRIQGRYRLT